jgi:two-component system sensor histidine kinase DegS
MPRGSHAPDPGGALASAGTAPQDSPRSGLARRLGEESIALDRELAEIEMLIDHARTEAGRHEAKRAAMAERLTTRSSAASGEAGELIDLANQLALLTKRASVMEAQIDVLEGKHRALIRYRDAIRSVVAELERPVEPAVIDAPGAQLGAPDRDAAAAESGPSAGSIIAAQEDLRRDIARSLHDGPVQGLTNIALQAQIVERLVDRMPDRAAEEAQALVAMVQATLDTTKSFLYDVRPMVLDDLGLVPTLRRAVRERSRRAGATVELESSGQDVRLSGDVETGVFRIVDDVMAGYLESGADRVSVKLDWTDQLVIAIVASRQPGPGDEPEAAAPRRDVPPALAEMIEERRRARRPHISDEAWSAIEERASAIGAVIEGRDEGTQVHLAVTIGGE